MFKRIHIVDDDAAVRDSLSILLEAHGYEVSVFQSGDEFLQADIYTIQGPILLDVRMPGRDGMTVLEQALTRNPDLLFIMMSGHADVSMAVRAMQKGARTFIEKPFEVSTLLSQFMKMSGQLTEKEAQKSEETQALKKLSKLTPREREVMGHLVDGKPNKIIANDLGLSVRTVETHRARLLSKLDIRSLSDLVRISMIESKPTYS